MPEYSVKLKIYGKGEHICKKCFHYAVCIYQRENNPIIECSHFVSQNKVFTNADKIRTMNDEEIALLLFSQRIDAYESHIGTKEEILNWLKKDTNMRKREE